MTRTVSSEFQQPVLGGRTIEGVSLRELFVLIDEIPDLIYQGRGASVTVETQNPGEFSLLWEILCEARTLSLAETPR